jgi:hypothetical protein
MLPAVRRAHQNGGDADRRARARAGVENQFGLQGGQRAVLACTDFEAQHALRRGIGSHELVHARVGQPHRAPRRQRQRGHGRLDETDLAAKAAADGHRLDLHLVVSQAKSPRDLVAHEEEPLRACVNRQVAERIDTRSAALGLHVTLVHPTGAKLPFDHDLSVTEACLDITTLELQSIRHVGRRGCIHGLAAGCGTMDRELGFVLLARLAHHGCISCHRFQQVDRHWQRFVLDLDRLDRVFGYRLGLGKDRGDRLTGVHGFVECQHDAAGVDGGLDIRDRKFAG